MHMLTHLYRCGPVSVSSDQRPAKEPPLELCPSISTRILGPRMSVDAVVVVSQQQRMLVQLEGTQLRGSGGGVSDRHRHRRGE